MTIGIDISALQGPHRMRGIGYTVLSLINNLPESHRSRHKFVFFMQDGETEEALKLLNLSGFNYEVRLISDARKKDKAIFSLLPGRLARLANSAWRQSGEIASRYRGSKMFGDISDIDSFIQPDQSQNLPRGKAKKILIIYDIIPYVLEWDYLWSYRTARLHNLPRLSALRCAARRYAYIKKLRVNIRRADKLISISEATKSDFEKYVKAPSSKIQVVPLGVAKPDPQDVNPDIKRYYPTSWGYMARPFKLGGEPFLLYVGGADHRRRLDDLVAAYNYLRAADINIRLVLTGDTLQGPDNIPTPRINQALKNSSYLDEIIFLGFVPDDVREMLYQKALAFVYPSMYEGFGLPVLEAMSHGTPVITYKNSSIPEVGGDAVIYADGYHGIASSVVELMGVKETKKKFSDAGLKQASKFSWGDTTKAILNLVSR